MKKTLLFLFSLFSISFAYAQDGTLDSNFANPNITPHITAITKQPDGKLLVATDFPYHGSTSRGLVRLHPDGSLDNSFSVSSLNLSNSVTDIHVLPDNKIIITGGFNTAFGATASAICRLNSDGSLDSSFNTGTSIGTNGLFITKCILQSDGKIIAVGNFKLYNGQSRRGVMRINTDGSLDVTFNPGTGYGLDDDQISTITMQLDGKIILGGHFSQFNGVTVNNIVRLNSNGSIDTSFNNGGIGFIDPQVSVADIKIQNDGKIIVAGTFSKYNGITKNNLVRLNSNGSLDNSFAPNIIYDIPNPGFDPIRGSLGQVDIQDDGKIIICGRFHEINGETKNNLARLNSDGSVDCSFHTLTYNSVYVASVGFDLLDNNKIIMYGSYTSLDGIPKNGIALLNNNGGINNIQANNDSVTTVTGTPLNYNGILNNDFVNGNPAGVTNIIISQISPQISGITLNTTTGILSISSTVLPGTYLLKYKICTFDSCSKCSTATVTITVNPQTIDAVNDNFSGTPIDYLTGGVTPSLLTNDIVNGAAANPADVILTLTNNGGVAGASINANGGINIPVGTLMNTYTLQYSICLISNPSICDTASVTVTVADRVITTPEIAFAIRANTTVFESQLQSTGKIIICGPFTKYNNVDAKHLVRLNTDLTQDTTFPALGSLPHPPEDFKVLPNDKIIAVGTFTSINGTPTPRGIARLNANGTVDTSFNAGGTGIDTNDRIISCAVQSDGKILLGGGYIHSYNGVPTRNMIRLNNDGTLDTSFVYPYTYDPSTFSSIYKIVVQPDGKILVSGNRSFASDALGNYIGQPHLFRLNTDGSLDLTFTTTVVEATDRDSSVCSTCIAPIQNIVLQPDGKIIIVGAFASFHGVIRKNNIVRLNSNGTLDATFQTNKASLTSDRVIKDAVVEPSGKIIIGGEFTTYNRASVNKLVRLNANGTVDATFSPGDGPTHANNYPGTVFDLNRQADGKVIVSGSFSHYNNISATNITRIAPEIPGSQARGNGIQLWNTEKEIGNNVQTTIGEISIYPNPSSGIFSVDLTQSKEPYTTIMVYNALGQKVYQTNSVPESVNEIDLSNLPDGYYYAQITGGKSSVQKVLIKK